MVRQLVLVSVVVLNGCVGTSSVQCGDQLCPEGTECRTFTTLGPKETSGSICPTSQQIADCMGKADGTACGTGAEECREGVCWPYTCGDGRQNSTEQCDDGNTDPGDGCSATCDSNETCGNKTIDPVVLQDGVLVPREACDDGNLADGDGCTSRCQPEAARWLQTSTERISPRTGAAMAYDIDHGVAVMFGGYDAPHSLGDTLLRGAGAWVNASPATNPVVRSNASMAYDADTHRVVMFGGDGDNNNGTYLSDTWEWNGRTWVERASPNTPVERAGAAMAYDSKRRRIVMFGGIHGGGANGGNLSIGDTWEWDGGGWTQIMPANHPSSRSGAALGFDPKRGVMVLFAGGFLNFNSTVTPNNETWTYNGTDWSLVTVSSPPAKRIGATMAWDPINQRLLMYGGNDQNGNALADTWAWTGTTWTPVIASASPPGPRAFQNMALDVARKRIVMVGGGTDLDSWEWNGTNWIDATPTLPGATRSSASAYRPARGQADLYDGGIFYETDQVTVTQGPNTPGDLSYSALGYDRAHDTTVMFGGQLSGNSAVQDTWLWNGTAWTKPTLSPQPGPREDAQIACDDSRGECLMFGGQTSPSATLGDTWIWNGTAWRDAMPASAPSARADYALGYDPVAKQIVLFGGRTADTVASAVGDTWTWNGTTWTHVTDAGPGKIEGASMAWDPSIGALVLYGGAGAAGTDVVFPSVTYVWKNNTWQHLVATNNPTGRELPWLFPSPGGLTMSSGARTGQAGPPLPFSDVWQLRFESTNAKESCVLDIDDDGDGLKGCADPDCAFWCAPYCVGQKPAAGQTTCDDSLPHCGDGVCNTALETCRTCPGDCGACTAVCGDTICDSTESSASCPGDCP